MALAERVATGIVGAVHGLPAFSGLKTAAQLRDLIRGRSTVVTLNALVESAWELGIVVIHLKHLPKGKKPVGMAMFVDQRPVVTLTSGHDSPSWLAFHLAHELGHVLLGHVTAGMPPLVDAKLDSLDNDVEESEANEFAFVVLTGVGVPAATAAQFGLTAPKLAAKVRRESVVLHADPGFLALRYGFGAGRMGVAQTALGHLALDHGGQSLIDEALKRRLDDQLSESAEQFVALATAS